MSVDESKNGSLGAPLSLSIVLAALMATQAVLGLAFPGQYRDAEWIRATWFGNDWVTLGLAAPLLVIALVPAARGSTKGTLLWLGVLGYGIYNYAFYLFGAALNVFLPLYIGCLLLSATALIVALTRLRVPVLRFREGLPAKVVGGYLIVVAVGLTAVWMGMWAAYVFADVPTPVEPEVFKLVAALDISLMAPVLVWGGVLLWRRRPWGVVIAAIGSIQGALYLTVLSVNSIVGILRGYEEAPGQLPVWGTLAIMTAAAAVALLLHAESSGGSDSL